MFCCENAHESRMDRGTPYSLTSSTNLLDFGGCGVYKNEARKN